jgi:predicted MFS family arabinose efflux permease
MIATLLAAWKLPETNEHMGEVKKGKLIDFPLLWKTLFDPNVGMTFIITLIFFLAFACALIYGFQPFTMNVLKITESQNAQLFTLFGVVGLISQNLLLTDCLEYQMEFRTRLNPSSKLYSLALKTDVGGSKI